MKVNRKPYYFIWRFHPIGDKRVGIGGLFDRNFKWRYKTEHKRNQALENYKKKGLIIVDVGKDC